MAILTINFVESDDIAAALRDIAAQVEDGFDSGTYPTWELSE